VNELVTWTLLTVGYVLSALLGAVGLRDAGEVLARWGRASAA
jgi:hypothetical protein